MIIDLRMDSASTEPFLILKPEVSEVLEEILPTCTTVRKKACHFSGVEKMTDVDEEVKKTPEMAFPFLTHQVWVPVPSQRSRDMRVLF